VIAFVRGTVADVTLSSVVLEVGGQLRLAAVVGTQQPAVRITQAALDELRGGHRRLDVVLTPEHGAGVGERRDHQRVP